MGEFKVYPVEGGYEVFWCPSAPLHYQDCIPHDGRVYKHKQAAYRQVSKLRAKLKAKGETSSEAA